MRTAAGKREELKAALEALIEPTKQEVRWYVLRRHHLRVMSTGTHGLLCD
jgi:hypothetical protein